MLALSSTQVRGSTHTPMAAATRESTQPHPVYDVVVSDVGMPGMSGHDLMRALRELPHIKQVPAIALTGYGAESDIEKSRQSGFDRHLGKPVSYDVQIETIEELRQKRVD